MIPEKHITIAHAHARNIGYGRMGVDIFDTLESMGYTASDWTEGWEQHVTPVEQVHTPGRAKTVVFVSPGTHVKGWFEGQRAVAFTMWEATELPEANRETLHEYDQIIVPSIENLKLYSRYHPNVKMVPLGVGPEWRFRPRDPLTYELDLDAPEETGAWSPTEGIMPSTAVYEGERGTGLPMSAPAFNFLCAGTSIQRKGIDLVAKAFQLAFPAPTTMTPRPELIFKSTNGTACEGVTQQVDGFLTETEELDLYQGAHCFVSAARGEGFGLQPLQAMAQGCPTILVDAHGHEAFAMLAGIQLPAKLVPAPEAMGFGEAGMWWECDVTELAAAMREVYENYAQFQMHAQSMSEVVHKEFSWLRTAKKLIEAIGEEHLTGLLDGWVAGPDGQKQNIHKWHALTPKSYLIRVTAPYKGTVNGVAYHYEPGMDYWDVADIKRQIHRMGFLDPSCINDDGVVKADPRFSGSAAFCPTCLQQLGSGIQKADVLLAAMEDTIS